MYTSLCLFFIIARQRVYVRLYQLLFIARSTHCKYIYIYMSTTLYTHNAHVVYTHLYLIYLYIYSVTCIVFNWFIKETRPIQRLHTASQTAHSRTYHIHTYARVTRKIMYRIIDNLSLRPIPIRPK